MELLSEKDDEIEKDEGEDMDASLEIDDTPAKGPHQVSTLLYKIWTDSH